MCSWCRLQGSNPRPPDYKSGALPTELSRQCGLCAGVLHAGYSGAVFQAIRPFRLLKKFFPKKYKFIGKKINLTILLSNNKNIKKLNKDGSLELPESLNGINVDIPPSNFDCDISTNVAMVLSKANKKSPIDIANTLIDLIKNEDGKIESISVAKPGFINIKFKTIYWNNFIKSINFILL